MRRFWSERQLDKYSAHPTIHATFQAAFERACEMTNERKQGDFAVFECVGCVKIRKGKKKKPATNAVNP